MPSGEKVGEVAKRFGVNPQTIRQWADQFAPFLSEDANPERGNTRHFTQEDIQVFALVAYMRSHDAPFDEIGTALQAGQRGLLMDLNLSGGLPITEQEGPISGVSAGGYLARVEDLAQALGFTKGELSRVEGELRIEREAHATTRQSEMEQRERAARAETMLEVTKSISLQAPAPDTRNTKLWRWALVVSVIVVIVLLSILVAQGLIR